MVQQRSPLDDHYFLWLCDQVDCENSESDRKNLELLSWLHSKDFYSLVPNDDNRIKDGLSLRGEYAEACLRKTPLRESNNTCSVLEMLIALAVRMDFNISQAPDDHQISKYFWEMIDNLGLKLSSYGFMRESNMIKLEKFLTRAYEFNGNGGLFPLSNPRRDQRKVEIWYQMMAYIYEKY